MCWGHHTRVHEGGWRVCSDTTGQVVFFTPMLGRDPVGDLVRRNREHGVTPDVRSGMPDCKRDSLIPWSIEAAALEALEALDEQSEAEPGESTTDPMSEKPHGTQEPGEDVD